MAKGEGSGEGGGEASGKGSGRADFCPGILWAVLWFLILIFIAWPIAFMLAGLYVFLLPFSACIDPLKEVCEALLKVLQLPLTCTEKMIGMEPLCGWLQWRQLQGPTAGLSRLAAQCRQWLAASPHLAACSQSATNGITTTHDQHEHEHVFKLSSLADAICAVWKLYKDKSSQHNGLLQARFCDTWFHLLDISAKLSMMGQLQTWQFDGTIAMTMRSGLLILLLWAKTIKICTFCISCINDRSASIGLRPPTWHPMYIL